MEIPKIKLNHISLEDYVKEEQKAFDEFKNSLPHNQVVNYMNHYNIESYDKARKYLAEYLYFGGDFTSNEEV